jgi:type II secretory pathway pseudopilin PulG
MRAPSHAGRQAITLLEVMISIMVMSIGLLGLASLIPVGRYQMVEALKLDSGTTLGRAAFRDILVRGAFRPENWLYCTSGTTTGTAVIGPAKPSSIAPVSTAFQVSPASGPQYSPPFAPLVLDPLGFANASQNGSAGDVTAMQTFPYGLSMFNDGPQGSAPRLSRITLRQFSSTSAACPFPYTSTGSSPLSKYTLTIMPYPAADRMFRSTDDLDFAIPNRNDPTLKPLQNWYNTTMISGTLGNPGAARMSLGAFSYLVTISPDLGEALGSPMLQSSSPAAHQPTQGNAATTRKFSVAVVAVYRRDLSPPTTLVNPSPGSPPRGERMAWVDFATRNDIRLRITTSGGYTAAKQALGVKENEWIMVTGKATNYMFGNPFTQTIIQWYRVVSGSIEPKQLNGTTWYRSLRVVGPDWNQGGLAANVSGASQGIFQDADGTGYPDIGNPPTGFGTIIGGAVGVYEKTMILDGSSLWSY